MELLMKVLESNLDKIKEDLLKDAVWSSDWNGYEVGYDDVPVVGYYTTNEDLGIYINTETGEILEVFDETEDE